MKNVFFEVALAKASKLLSTKARVMILLGKLAAKLRTVNWKEVKAADLKEKVSVCGRLLKAFVTGKYTAIPWKPLLLVTAAVIYFVNPIDLIPDWVLAVGFTDDISILVMVYSSVHTELQKFLEWEKSQLPPPVLSE